MPPPLTEKDILAVLEKVMADSPIGKAGQVSGVVIKDGNVGFTIEIAPDTPPDAATPLKEAAERAVLALDGVTSATAMLTAHRAAAGNAAPAGFAAPAASVSEREAQKANPRGANNQERPKHRPARHVIAVASGKGGVGKSTTAINLALAMQNQGRKTAILDADIYGPSLPRLLGTRERPQVRDGRIIPIRAHGLVAMSIGFLLEDDAPTVWRGPMVMSAIEQMLRDVDWGAPDILVVDMPPGTGDAQLTLAQRCEVAGAVIVSTPQDLALVDARKGLEMFGKVGVPVLGIIENMSYFICPSCGERSEIFSHGGAEAEAARSGAPFLGRIPLDMAIRETSDGGAPIVASAPASDHAEAYTAIAEKILAGLS